MAARREKRRRHFSMGRELWYHKIAWHADPGEALRAFQADLFCREYDYDQLFRDYADPMREALARAREEGDQFGLCAQFEQAVKIINEVSAKPRPADAIEQIAVLRRIMTSVGPDGFGNILDVRDVSAAGDYYVTRRLPPEEVEALTGSARPTSDQAVVAIDGITDTLARAGSACFEVYGADGDPVGWFFVGYTMD